MCSFAMPWMVRLPLGIRTIENIGTSAKENIMAKFFKDPDGKLIALSLIHISEPTRP